MTKELSIKSIKEDIAKALLEDVRIIGTFKNRGEKKTKDFIGSCIFGYFRDDTAHTRVNTYVTFDVMEKQDYGYQCNENYYKVFIHLKAHQDLLGNGATNCLDDIAEYVKEIISELYPYYRDYLNMPKEVKHGYTGRDIEFTVFQRDAAKHERLMELMASKEENKQVRLQPEM